MESIINLFLWADCNIDETIKLLLNGAVGSIDFSPFDHLIKTFPDVEIESIEAFLLTQDEISHLDAIEKEFMKQTGLTNQNNVSEKNASHVKSRDRPLKMNLSDFNALLKTSKDALQKNRPVQFSRSTTFTCKSNLYNHCSSNLFFKSWKMMAIVSFLMNWRNVQRVK